MRIRTVLVRTKRRVHEQERLRSLRFERTTACQYATGCGSGSEPHKLFEGRAGDSHQSAKRLVGVEAGLWPIDASKAGAR